MLTREAFNALLKSLEEPPPYILFVFATTERHKVPATILSRCQQLDFRPVATEQIVHRLLHIAGAEGFALTAGAAGAVARAAQGSVRDALSLLDQLRAFAGGEVDEESVASVLGVPRLESLVRLLETLANGDARAGLTVLRGELAAGYDATVLFQEAGRMLQTLLHLVLDPGLEPALTEDQRALLEPLATSIGEAGLARMLGMWSEQEPLLQGAANRELALEVAALRLARWPDVRRLEQVLAGGGALAVPGSEDGGSSAAGPGRSGGSRGGPAPPARRRTGGAGAAPAVSADDPPAEGSGRSGADLAAITRAARRDPQVELVLRVIGGEIAGVAADRDGGDRGAGGVGDA
jgi:DNA polymerase-3 subunit gamma/tau